MANRETPSYMDNVRVKISEKYKPPPKIGLVMSYAQRLTLNKQIQDTIPNYEFLLEKTVIEKMREWKTARSVMFQQLKDRLSKARVEFEEKVKNEDSETVLTTSQCFQQSQSILLPTKATNSYSNILTPIPLKEQNSNCKSPDKSPFNISDFEADTSSPFDNMELKSINDLEELAQVLKQDQDPKLPSNFSAQSSTSLTYPVVGNYSYTIPTTSSFVQPGAASLYSNGYYYPETTSYPYTNQMENRNFNYSPVQDTKNYNNIPDIMKTLQNELDNTHIDNTVVKTSDLSKVKTKRSDDFPEEFYSLPKNLQEMSKAISLMGFPLNRVVRVCKVVGNDQKKVVEHLLAMSELLDLGFPENRVSTALLQCDNDRDKALDILIS